MIEAQYNLAQADQRHGIFVSIDRGLATWSDNRWTLGSWQCLDSGGDIQLPEFGL